MNYSVTPQGVLREGVNLKTAPKAYVTLKKTRSEIREAPIQAKYHPPKHYINEGFKPPAACQNHSLASGG